MSSVVSLVNSTPLYGGLSDGYRRSQLGNPSGTVGQPPKFRGETNVPGSNVKAPRILSSSARNNRATNVTIPYTRVCAADELVNKGRLSPGDVAFISRLRYSALGTFNRNHQQSRQFVASVSHPHADVCRLVGLDWVNKMLGVTNYVKNNTVLVDSYNPLDDWRKLKFLNTYTLDGVVMSDDTPGYVLNSSSGARNDQVFNMGIQGPVQLNNGFEDTNGRGVEAFADKYKQNLIAGPSYTQYPIQMFDRKLRPMSDLYIGLICRKVLRDADSDPNKRPTFEGETVTGVEVGDDAKHIHIFQYICFSSRQVDQFATKSGEPGTRPDPNIVDTGLGGRIYGGGKIDRDGDDDYYLGEAEPASHRRGPNDPKRARNDNFLPRKRQNSGNQDDDDNFLGIKAIELKHMVGAWRIGKVLDIASQRKEQFTGGPVDTSFAVTLNLDISFLDWRQLRRNFTMNIFGYDLDRYGTVNGGSGAQQVHWTNYDAYTQKFENDDGRVMMWPTMYYYDDEPSLQKQKQFREGDTDGNIPYDPSTNRDGFDVHDLKKPIKDQRDAYTSLMTESRQLEETTSPAADPPTTGTVPPPPAADPAADPATPPASADPTPPPPVAPPPATEPAAAAPAAAAVNANPTSKAASKAPVAPVVGDSATASGKQAAKPATTARTAPKKPATAGAIGDDVMASIFGSAKPSSANLGASATETSEQTDGDGRASQPKSFPRRRDR